MLRWYVSSLCKQIITIGSSMPKRRLSVTPASAQPSTAINSRYFSYSIKQQHHQTPYCNSQNPSYSIRSFKITNNTIWVTHRRIFILPSNRSDIAFIISSTKWVVLLLLRQKNKKKKYQLLDYNSYSSIRTPNRFSFRYLFYSIHTLVYFNFESTNIPTE